MKRVAQLALVAIVGLWVAAVAVPLFAGNPLADARAATRLMTSDVSGAKCSAVVIAPGVALTAKHCVDSIPEMKVDGKAVVGSVSHLTQDISRLTVPGLDCPCVDVSTVAPQRDETVIVVGWLYGDMLITSRGEYGGVFTNPDDKQGYGIYMGLVGHGMSGGGVFRVFVTGEVRLVGILSAMGQNGFPGIYVEVDAQKVKTW